MNIKHNLKHTNNWMIEKYFRNNNDNRGIENSYYEDSFLNRILKNESFLIDAAKNDVEAGNSIYFGLINPISCQSVFENTVTSLDNSYICVINNKLVVFKIYEKINGDTEFQYCGAFYMFNSENTRFLYADLEDAHFPIMLKSELNNYFNKFLDNGLEVYNEYYSFNGNDIKLERIISLEVIQEIVSEGKLSGVKYKSYDGIYGCVLFPIKDVMEEYNDVFMKKDLLYSKYDKRIVKSFEDIAKEEKSLICKLNRLMLDEVNNLNLMNKLEDISGVSYPKEAEIIIKEDINKIVSEKMREIEESVYKISFIETYLELVKNQSISMMTKFVLKNIDK